MENTTRKIAIKIVNFLMKWLLEETETLRLNRFWSEMIILVQKCFFVFDVSFQFYRVVNPT